MTGSAREQDEANSAPIGYPRSQSRWSYHARSGSPVTRATVRSKSI